VRVGRRNILALVSCRVRGYYCRLGRGLPRPAVARTHAVSAADGFGASVRAPVNPGADAHSDTGADAHSDPGADACSMFMRLLQR